MSGLSAEYMTRDEFSQRWWLLFNMFAVISLLCISNIIWLVSRTLKSFKKDHSQILPTTSTTENKETENSASTVDCGSKNL